MITKQTLKEVMLDGKRYILELEGTLVPRRDAILPLDSKKVVIIYGVRRCGKSCLLYDIFLKNRNRALYVDMEDDRLSGFRTEHFDMLWESFFEINPHLVNQDVFVLLDEIQDVVGWEKFCRRLAEREGAFIFVSGSSSKMMPQNFHTSLRGRAWSVELMPFSFGEYLDAKGINHKDPKLFMGKNKTPVTNALADYFKYGGYPEVVLLKSEFEKKKILKEYFGAMYFRDLVERYNMNNIHLLDALLDVILSSPAQNMSLTAFQKQFKGKFPFSKDMLYGYYKNIKDSMFFYETRKQTRSSYRRMRNPPKIYLIDTGLAKRAGEEEQGRILENVVYLELKRRGFDITYYSNTGECDFVVRNNDGQIECLQVTCELLDHNREREVAGLIEACSDNKKKEGTIITLDQHGEIEEDEIKITLIPVWDWILRRFQEL